MARELLVTPVPNDLLSRSLVVLPVPESLDPERMLSLLVEALKLAAEQMSKADRADLAKLQIQLAVYGNRLVLPWQTRMISSAGFFKKGH